MIKKAMIMAAGVGSRLDPLTRNVPKPLIPVANQPLMDLILKKLEKNGVKEVIANTFCLAEQIQNRYVKNNPTSVSFNYIQEETLSGTAGGVKKCEFFLKGEKSFLVLSGDGLFDVDFDKLYDSHQKSGAIATMALTYVPHEKTCNFGVVVVDEKGLVRGFQEKPSLEQAKSNLINTGIYIFDSEIFKLIPENTFYDFAKNVFPSMLEAGMALNTYIINGYWSDIGTIEQYKKSSLDILESKIKLDIEPVQNGCLIAQDALLSPFAMLKGRNIIGHCVKIAQGVTLEDCILWDGVTIEEGVSLKNTIVMNGSVKRGTVAEDTILHLGIGDKKLMSC